jgi:tRNA-dihydrouridine synthase
LGFNEVDYSWPEFLLEQDIAVLTMHGRTRKQMSKVPADWDAIGKVRELRDKLGVATHIVGNGDVMTRQQGLELATTHQLDGIMIGRGIFQDPYVFTSESPWHKMGALERLELYKKHVELFAETWGDTGRHVRVLNKFCKVYINDFPSAKHLREQLMNAQHTDELLQLLEQATKYEFTRA